MKPFKLGLIIGRFQLLHKGHESLINTGLQLCERLVICIGSAQESGTEKNPFDYLFRKKVLEKIYGDRLTFIPLMDQGLGNNSSWGKYVLDAVAKELKSYPDLIISGHEQRRDSWFADPELPKVSELIINRNAIKISSTELKQFLVDDNNSAWKMYTNPKIHGLYKEMRNIYLGTLNNTSTCSI